MNKKKVSIIIPYYNGEKFIEDLLKSILKQSYKNYELIIINDGSNKISTVKLIKLINYYKEKVNIIYFEQPNGGISAARNKGIELSTGEYITFIDQDDMLCGRYSIDYRLSFLESNPVFDIIGGYAIKIDYEGKIIPTKPPLLTEKYIETINNDMEQSFPCAFMNYYLERRKLFYFITGSSLLRSRSIKDFRFDSSFDKVEDIEFVIRLLGNNKRVAFQKIPFYLKRTHSSQASIGTSEELEIKLKNQILQTKKLLNI